MITVNSEVIFLEISLCYPVQLKKKKIADACTDARVHVCLQSASGRAAECNLT